MAAKFDSDIALRNFPAGPQEPQNPPSTKHDRPNRVLALAVVAAIALLIAVDISADALWNLLDGRYANEVIDDAF